MTRAFILRRQKVEMRLGKSEQYRLIILGFTTGVFPNSPKEGGHRQGRKKYSYPVSGEPTGRGNGLAVLGEVVGMLNILCAVIPVCTELWLLVQILTSDLLFSS